jgi:hypothetical protein
MTLLPGAKNHFALPVTMTKIRCNDKALSAFNAHIYVLINARPSLLKKERNLIQYRWRTAVSRFLFVFGAKQWNESKSHAGFVVHSEE